MMPGKRARFTTGTTSQDKAVAQHGNYIGSAKRLASGGAGR